MGSEAALVFSTGDHANLVVVAALSDAETLVVSDAHVHASMIDACRLAEATVSVVPHDDVSAAADGIRIWCLRPRSTPEGVSRLRLTAHAHPTSEAMRPAAKVLREIGTT